MPPNRFRWCHLADLAAVDCPCGTSRRAFLDVPEQPASIHLVEVHQEAVCHYHRHMTEIYYILSGEGEIELDGTLQPVKPGDAILIQPGCRHRAMGRLTLLNVAIPTFDPTDEWFD